MNKNLNLNNKNSLLEKLNVSKVICNHIVGENHSDGHRICCGILVVFFGVWFSKLGVNMNWAIHYLTDASGYLIHGIGSIPILDYLSKKGGHA